MSEIKARRMGKVQWYGWMMILAGGLASGLVLPVGAEERSPLTPLAQGGTSPEVPLASSTAARQREDLGGSKLRQQPINLRRQNRPATTVKEWIAQIEAATVQVTGVTLNRTEVGLDIVLQTAEGKPLQVDATKFRQEGNALIADIPNAVLALPQGQPFVAENPMPDIATVRVVQQDVSSIRIDVTGNNALPKTEVTLKTGEFAYSLNPERGEPDEEIVVKGEQNRYAVPNASTATKTDTPLRDIPQSIQVIPSQVLKDQQVRDLNESVRNISGVYQGDSFSNTRDSFILRGFSTLGFRSQVFRDGFRDPGRSFSEISNIERIEALKGPASILFGGLEPGGIINLITKKPLSTPFAEVGLQVGSFGFFRPTIDLSGPLDTEKNVLYRLNAAYETSRGFREFDQDVQRFFVAPTIAIKISDRTNLSLNLEYTNDRRPFDSDLPAIDTEVADIPRTRILGEPGDFAKNEELKLRYLLEHQFSDNLTLRHGFRFVRADTFDYAFRPRFVNPETGILARRVASNDDLFEAYSVQTNLIGKFSTGSVKHTLLFGVDLDRQTTEGTNRGTPTPGIIVPGINIFDPVDNLIAPPPRDTLRLVRDDQQQLNALGIYLQDQITILDNLKLLAGVRFDTINQKNSDFRNETTEEAPESAFSPRVGIVYQPIQPLSLYASFSQGFNPNLFTDEDGLLLKPERSTQFEVGARAEVLNGGLIINLAAYEITKRNVAAFDPIEFFATPLGKVRSRGIEFDVIGKLANGWNIVASYAYTDVKVTEDLDPIQVGRQLGQVPRHGASLWTTYQLPTGDLQGLGFGFGVFYTGDRVDGTFDPIVNLPGFVRTDAAIFYRRNNLNIALNVKNLFNVKYIESNFYKPGAPLTVVGSVSFTF
jgi:iron complex outermembrane receptor protein